MSVVQKLPAGKDRVSFNHEGDQRMTIGMGEHAAVYRMLGGVFEGLVCRSPIHKPSVLNTEQEGLLRFRRHQIAHAVFPEFTLDVKAINVDTREMFSTEVVRSKENLRDCTRVGLNRRKERTLEPLDDDIQLLARKMLKAGIEVEANKPNVSKVRNADGISVCFLKF